MTQEGKRILVMAGGTGGHVFPALAVAKYLAQQMASPLVGHGRSYGSAFSTAIRI